MNKYPQIYFPDYFYEIRLREVKFSDLFPKLRRPESPVLTLTYPRPIFEAVKVFFGLFILLFFILLIFLGVFLEHSIIRIGNIELKNQQILISIDIILSILFSYFFYRLFLKLNNQDKDSYQYSLKLYNSQKPRFDDAVKSFNDQNLRDEFKQKLFIKTINDRKKQIENNITLSEENGVKRGPSEMLFISFLKAYSKYEVIDNCGMGWYFPDIVLFDKDRNLAINIEIDEPYSLNEKIPIHYEGLDEERNSYFTKCGFIVVRFCEEQIVRSPRLCLLVIDQLILDFLNLTEPKEICDLIDSDFRFKSWTYTEAEIMALQNSRKEIFQKISIQRILHNI